MERNRIYLIAFIVLILVAGIAVGIYFAVKDSDDSAEEVKWVMIGNNSAETEVKNNIMYSIDGKNWETVNTESQASDIFLSLAYGKNNKNNSLWLTNYANDDSSKGFNYYSEDGKKWLKKDTGILFFNLAYGTSDGTSPLWTGFGTGVSQGLDGDGEIFLYNSNDGLNWKKLNTGFEFIPPNTYENLLKYGSIAYGTSDGTSPLWVATRTSVLSESFGNNILYSFIDQEFQKSTGASFAYSGNGIAYGTIDGTSPLWVAVGNDFNGNLGRGNIMYSADGISWQQSTGGSFTIEGNGVAYGTSNGTSPLWVAVGSDSGNRNIMYSADGKEWQQTTAGASFASLGNGVAYGTSNGTSPLWVAVGNDGDNPGNGNILYSNDGISWQESTGGSFAYSGNEVAYGTSNGTSPLWVAVGYDGVNGGPGGWGNIMYSENGKEWQQSNGASFSYNVYDIAYGTSDGSSPLWVAVGKVEDGNGKSGILYSENGKEWNEIKGSFFLNNVKTVAYKIIDGNPRWLAGGNNESLTATSTLLQSSNGKDWLYYRDEGGNFRSRFSAVNKIAFGEGDFFLTTGRNDILFGNNKMLYSEDGLSWKESAGTNFPGLGVAYGTSDGTSPLWVAVGNTIYGGNSNIIYSTDGKEWQESTGSSFSGIGTDIAYGTSDGTNPLWVAVGYDSFGVPNDNYKSVSLLFSENGKNWEKAFTNFGISKLIERLTISVAYGRDSENKPLWYASAYAFASDFPSVGVVFYSNDGKNWKLLQNPFGLFPMATSNIAFKSILPNVPNFY